MINITVEKLQEITGGKLYRAGDILKEKISCVVSDSRKTEKGCLFLCIKGEKADGHDFIADAYYAGALLCMGERRMPRLKKPYLLVDSVLIATMKIAEYYRQSLDVKTIGITGSVGKTTTKELIAGVLGKKFRVYKTSGNLNNEWGVPFTMFGLTDDYDFAVIEMGISDFGEMDRLSRIVRPDVVVFTVIGNSHLENLKDREGVFRAKSEIFNHCAKDALVCLNGDDDILTEIVEVRGKKPLYYGFSSGCEVTAEKISDNGINGSSFDLVARFGQGKLSVRVSMKASGEHLIKDSLCAALVGLEMGVGIKEIKSALEQFEPYEGRDRITQTKRFNIIDDCYNASPESMKATLDLLQKASGRKVAILGDMLELGEDSAKFHHQIGQYAAFLGTDLIICVGKQSEETARGARLTTNKDVYYFGSVSDALSYLPNLLRNGDTILVKASNAMGFSQILDFLKEL